MSDDENGGGGGDGNGVASEAKEGEESKQDDGGRGGAESKTDGGDGGGGAGGALSLEVSEVKAETEAEEKESWGVCPLESCVFEISPAAAADGAGGGDGGGGMKGKAGAGASAAVVVEELPCSLLLSCHGLDVRPSLFRALNGSGLAYDGRLVVDPLTMATSDPSVFAGGDLTKFSRK
jgi:hypothetical protein